MVKAAPPSRTARKPAARKRATSAAAKTAKTTERTAKTKAKTGTTHERPAKTKAKAGTTQIAAKRVTTAAERDRRFNLLLQTACLKAGSAAAIGFITSKVPFLGRFAPALLGTMTETLALGRIHQKLVRDTLDLYELDLSEIEERGVILLATAGSIGAQQLSKQMVDQIVKQLGGRYLRLLAARALPLASLITEIAAAIASTYAVGRRAQVLCTLPGSGARNLGELLRSLTGIDQRRLFSWSGEALKLALAPFRSLLGRTPGPSQA